MRDQGVHQVCQDFQDCKVCQDHKVERVTVVIQARGDLQVHQAHRAHLVPQGLKERLERLVHQELKDQEVLKVTLVCLAWLVTQEKMVSLDHVDFQGLKVRMAHLDHKDPRDPEDYQVLRGQKEIQGQLDSQVMP